MVPEEAAGGWRCRPQSAPQSRKIVGGRFNRHRSMSFIDLVERDGRKTPGPALQPAGRRYFQSVWRAFQHVTAENALAAH